MILMNVSLHNRILNSRYLDDFRRLIPDVMYHITPHKRIKSILADGILINQPRTTVGGQIFGVYLSNDPEFLYEIGEYKASETGVIGVSTRQLLSDLYIDSEFYPNDPESIESFLDDIKSGVNIISTYSTKAITRDLIRSVRLWLSLDNPLTRQVWFSEWDFP